MKEISRLATRAQNWAAYRSLPTPEVLSKLAALYLYSRREIEAIATQLWEPKPLTAGSPEVTQIALDAARLFGERAEGMKGRVVLDLMQYLWPKAPQSVEEALGMLYMGFPEYTLRAAPATDEAGADSDKPSVSNAAG